MPRSERNKFVKRGQILELSIEDYAFGGKGIARIRSEEGVFVVFVPNTIPGQKVKAQVKKSSKNYAECKLIDVLENSKDEVSVPCLLYTSPSPRDRTRSRMPSSA